MARNPITKVELKALADAQDKGFMDCKVIVRALYPNRFPDRPVRWDAAYRWLADVNVAVVYIIPDGATKVSKAERTGCWSSDFPKVLAYKTAYYQQIALNDWTRNVEGAVSAGLSQRDAEEMMGPRPPTPEVFVDTAWKASGTKARQETAQVEEQEATEEQDETILAVMREWEGPVNKKGKPKPTALAAVVGFGVTRKRRNRLWAIIEEED